MRSTEPTVPSPQSSARAGYDMSSGCAAEEALDGNGFARSGPRGQCYPSMKRLPTHNVVAVDADAPQPAGHR
jgi:hypothetical protein